jgi:hypothetical protein
MLMDNLKSVLDIVCKKKMGVSKMPLVDQYHFNFGFRITLVRNIRQRRFFISYIVTGFHCSLHECLVRGRGIGTISCVYKFAWLMAVSISS